MRRTVATETEDFEPSPQKMLNTQFRNIFEIKGSEVIRVKDDDDKFEISLDTSQYRPDEIRVNVEEGKISVEGKHEEKSEDGRRVVLRQFSRKYSLPTTAKPEKVTSDRSKNGVLIITAKKDIPQEAAKDEKSSKMFRVPMSLRDRVCNDSFFKNFWDEFQSTQNTINQSHTSVDTTRKETSADCKITTK